MSGPDFPRGHLHIIPRFAMFSKNQLKQKQVIHLGDTGMPTQSCHEQKTRLLRLQQLMVSSPQMEPFLELSPKDKQGSV